MDAGHILIILAADVEFQCLLRLKVINQHIHHRIVLASLGVLIGIIFRVKLSPHLHGILFHTTLVETVEGNLLAIRRPIESLGDTKLLFIHPVGGAVNHLVKLAIGSDGSLFQ